MLLKQTKTSWSSVLEGIISKEKHKACEYIKSEVPMEKIVRKKQYDCAACDRIYTIADQQNESQPKDDFINWNSDQEDE